MAFLWAALPSWFIAMCKKKNNGYIIAQKGALKIGDRVLMHGHEGIITEKRFLDW